jgi:phage host-nuclease inhibitor protein Gam
MPELEQITTEEREQDSRLSEDFLEGLHDYMDEEEIKELNIQDMDTFQIKNKEQANYFIKKIMDVRSEASNINHIADTEITKTKIRVDAWREKELNKLARDEEYITNLLEIFAAKELEGAKKKSLSLPYGSIGFRAQQPEYTYDDKTLLEFLLGHEEYAKFINYKPSTNKTDLKKTATVKDGKLYIDGIEIPGVTVTERDPKFEVKDVK